MSIFDKCYDYTDVEFVKQSGLYGFYRKCQGLDGSNVIYDGRSIIMAASSNYLGLSSDPRVIEAATVATQKYGASCTGSRLLNGNYDLHEELETELAEFLGKESAMVLSSGFLANQAAIESLASSRDTIISDRDNHASIISGCTLSKAKLLRYEHSSMADLSEKLGTLEASDNAIIISDGVFSMGGDIANLPEMVRLAKRSGKKKVPILIDDAHGLGVLGEGGRGIGSHYGMADDVDLIVGPLSKALASVGGFIAGNSEVINYIKHKARSMMFTAGLPAGPTAAALQALRIMRAEPERLERLRKNAATVKKAFREMGLNVLHTESPIIPVLVGEEGMALKLGQELFQRGLFATPVPYPAVPYGQAIIRTSFMSTHTDEQIQQVIDIFASLVKPYKLDQTESMSRDKNAAYSFTKAIGRRKLMVSGTRALLKRKIIKFASTI